MKYLFIGGCQRSGTTALADLLNEDPRLVIGRERYKRVVAEITPAHFRPGRFFSPTRAETNHLAYHARGSALHRKLKAGSAEYLGDKVPRYFTAMRRILVSFPTGKFVFLLRDLNGVANSFQQRAVDENDAWPRDNDYTAAPTFWNKSLMHLSRVARSQNRGRVFVVQYERFYAGETAYLESLYDFLELELTDTMRAAFERATEDWPSRASKPLLLDDQMLGYLDERRNRELEQIALEMCPAPV